jgi:hypothetical protein
LLKSSHGSEDTDLPKGKLLIGTQKSNTLYDDPNNASIGHYVAKVIYLRPEIIWPASGMILAARCFTVAAITMEVSDD